MTSGPQLPIPETAPGTATEWRLASADGQEQYGPTVEAVFARWVAEGRVKPDWLVWRTGWPQWKTAVEAADELPGAAPSLSSLPASSAPPPQPPANAPPPAEGAVARYQSRRSASAQRRSFFALMLLTTALALIALLLWLVRSGS